jgi:hypothetical protein
VDEGGTAVSTAATGAYASPGLFFASGLNVSVQQANVQAQNAMNQYSQQMQQAVPQMQQQVTAQMPTYQAPPTTNASWNPFATPAQSLPPARATPSTAVPSY